MSGRRGSLSFRIAALAVAAALVTALIGGLVSVRLIRESSQNGARQTLARVADDVQADFASAPVRSNSALRALRIDSAIIGRGGRVISTDALARDALTPGQIQMVLAGRPVSAVQKADGQTVLVEARPTTYGGFVLVQPRNEAVAVGNRAGRQLLYGLLIACAVAALLGLVVARRLSRPLRQTAAAAHALAGGTRDVRVDPDGPAEVADVASALNTLGDNLAHSEARQRDFLLSVSHDLRTPLTAITGYAESLADGVVADEETERIGQVMLGEARRLERYVADLLDLARLGAQELRMDFAPVDLAALVDATAAAWSGRCRAVGVELITEQARRPLPVDTDSGRVRQVLDGLLENALRVVPEGRPIVLATRAEARPDSGVALAVVEVRDGGPGLSDDDLSVAFERSALYNRYRGVRQVGTGLGLAIVHQLVGRLGGSIEAGHAVEGGARFTVRLPELTSGPASVATPPP